MFIQYIRFLIKEYLFALIALAFTIAYWVSAKNLPAKSIDFPKALLLIIIPLFIWNAVNSVREFKKLRSDSTVSEQSKWDWSLHITKDKVVITIFTIIYLVSTPIVGFFACSIIYLAGLAYYLGVRRPVSLVCFSLLYTATLYGIFVLWLQIRMPAGFLF